MYRIHGFKARLVAVLRQPKLTPAFMYIGIDLGTSSVKTLLVNEQQRIVGSALYELSVERLHPSWSEQDPNSWILGIEATFAELQQHHSTEWASVKSIGLSGHQHGATLIDAADKPLRACILWNDTRSHEQAAKLDTALSRDITGNILFPGFTAPKLAWVAENEPSIFEKVSKVLLPKDYARLWLCGDYVGDQSDSAGTGWLDVAKREWSAQALCAANWPPALAYQPLSSLQVARVTTLLRPAAWAMLRQGMRLCRWAHPVFCLPVTNPTGRTQPVLCTLSVTPCRTHGIRWG